MEAKAVSIGFGDLRSIVTSVSIFKALVVSALIGLRVGGTRATAVEGFGDVVAVDFGTMRVGDEIQATLGGIYASSGVACSWEIFDGIWFVRRPQRFRHFLAR